MQQQNNDDDAAQGLRELRRKIDGLLAENVVIESEEEVQDLRDLIDGMIAIVDTQERSGVIAIKAEDFLRNADDYVEILTADEEPGLPWLRVTPRYHYRYILDEQGNPVPTTDDRAAHRLMRNIKKRTVKKTYLEFRGIKVEVSTVFTVWNLAVRPGTQPVLWDTMVFAPRCRALHNFQESYHSRREAEQGHRLVVDVARAYLHRKRSIHSPRRMAVAQRRIAAGQSVLREATTR